MNKPFRIWIVGFLVALLAFLIYADAVNNDFIWDDPIVIKSQLPYFNNFTTAFLTPEKIPDVIRNIHRAGALIGSLEEI